MGNGPFEKKAEQDTDVAVNALFPDSEQVRAISTMSSSPGKMEETAEQDIGLLPDILDVPAQAEGSIHSDPVESYIDNDSYKRYKSALDKEAEQLASILLEEEADDLFEETDDQDID